MGVSVALLVGNGVVGAPEMAASGLEHTRGCWPVAAFAAMATVHVYSTEPSGIASTLSIASTSARNPVHAVPLQPFGRKAKDVAPLPMSGFTEQSGLPLSFDATGLPEA